MRRNFYGGMRDDVPLRQPGCILMNHIATLKTINTAFAPHRCVYLKHLPHPTMPAAAAAVTLFVVSSKSAESLRDPSRSICVFLRVYCR